MMYSQGLKRVIAQRGMLQLLLANTQAPTRFVLLNSRALSIANVDIVFANSITNTYI